jgi:Ras-related protein Rab-21
VIYPYFIVVLGESRVGKTSIMLRYCKNVFDDGQISTTDASNLEKNIKVDDYNVKLFIWDTAGQEEYHALNQVYYRDAVAAILVYDVTDRDSFDKVQTWVEELRLYLPKDTPIAIAGNKYDLPNRQIEIDEVENYAKEINGAHFDTSAKTGKGIEELFTAITKAVLRKNKKQAKEKAAKKNLGKKKMKSKKAAFGVDGEDDEDMKLGEISAGGYGGIRLSTYQDPDKKKKKK